MTVIISSHFTLSIMEFTKVCVKASVCANALRMTELCGVKASVCKSVCV